MKKAARGAVKSKTPLNIVLAHDWLTGMRGGEIVLDAIAEIFPHSTIYTLLYVPGSVSPILRTIKRKVSLLQKIPSIEKRYRNFLPLMPYLMGSFKLENNIDLIISSSHCVAKGIQKPRGCFHISYVHAPMRYMWDRFDDYFGKDRASAHVRLAAKFLRKYFKDWDKRVSQEDRVDALIANSEFISKQIYDSYGRVSKVVYPFADTDRFDLPRKPGRNYLVMGAMAPYKRVDIAIEAFNKLGLPLMVVGHGQEYNRLKKLAGPTVDLMGSLSDKIVNDLFSKCRAFIFPGKEDFGIAPVEAMCAGVPVIAYGAGGAIETASENTGIFFQEQSAASLMEAVMKFERGDVVIKEEDCRRRGQEFSRERFQTEFLKVLINDWCESGRDLEKLKSTVKQGWAKIPEELWEQTDDAFSKKNTEIGATQAQTFH